MCNSLCTASIEGWKCTGGDSQNPSTCLPICGDKKVLGNEKCDAGTLPGCMEDCSSNLSNYICVGGNATSPSICTIIGDSKSEGLVQSA